MAKEEKEPKRRLIKKAETVREKVGKSAAPTGKKPRHVRKHTRRLAAPFTATGRGLKKLTQLKPFKKPLRILGLILFPPYFRRSLSELRQVTWPTRRESLQLTFAVITFAAIFGVLVAALDFGLDKLFKQVLLK